MSAWGALWQVTPSGAVPGTVTSILSGPTHPQGVQTAPGGVGTLYIRTTDGALFRKLGGGSTAYGWYAVPRLDAAGFLGWRPSGANAACFARGANNGDFSGNPSTIFAAPPTISGGTTLYDRQKQYAGGYTSAVVNNIWIGGPASTINSWPAINIGNNYAPTSSPFDFDLLWEVITTPRSHGTAGATTLADVRLYAGCLMQNTTIQASGGTGNSDLIYTEFPSSINAVNQGMFGIMWRFSPTTAGDSTWMLCTANDDGAVSGQTATSIGAAVTVDTIYRLRARFVLVGGVWTVFGSVNDGTETAITANVGPGNTPAGANAIRLLPYLSCRTLLAAAVKSFAFSEMSLVFGREAAAA